MTAEIKLARIEVKLPPEESLVSALRLLVSGLASRLGFNTDEIEDLKFAVSEAFLAVVERSRGQQGVITLRWEETPEQLTVRITDPSHTHTTVTSTPIFELIKRVAGEVIYEEGEQPTITIRFKNAQQFSDGLKN